MARGRRQYAPLNPSAQSPGIGTGITSSGPSTRASSATGVSRAASSRAVAGK